MTPANLRNARMSAKLLYSSLLILTGIGYLPAPQWGPKEAGAPIAADGSRHKPIPGRA